MTDRSGSPDLQLVRLERDHLPALRDMAQEFRDAGDPRLDAVLDDVETFWGWVCRFEAGIELPPDRVPQTWYVVREGDRILGACRLRHRLIPVLELDGGNIGYEVRPSARGRGVATRMLGFVLDEARAREMTRVLLTAAVDNAASRRVIEKHGGVEDGTTVSPNTGETMQRYWITL